MDIGQRREADELAARFDRRKLPIQARANEQKQRSRRRLLERFQEAVRRLLVEIVGVVDDADLAVASRGLSEKLRQKSVIASMGISFLSSGRLT